MQLTGDQLVVEMLKAYGVRYILNSDTPIAQGD